MFCSPVPTDGVSVNERAFAGTVAAGKYKIKGGSKPIVKLACMRAAEESKSGIDHMSKIPQMFPNPASRARTQYFLINDSSN